ncbi:uncharacterized protein LOC122311907 [Carya illinoinensis]|uniref:uncharacterized protein LOC122311907 n=1 Tax=Carya illinoinensis TaxID=32201 RepID=UPI001C7280CA|nr:uncharacterized protein LOC122311907 [Carya illinoinensis]
MEDSALVSELIDKQSCSWKTGLVHEMFETEEAKLICRIPLSITNASNKLVWRGSKDGLFSVKSAFHLLNEVDGRELGQTSRSMQEESYHLLWRAILESLPTKRNLFKRKIIDSPLCPVCLSKEEPVVSLVFEAMDEETINEFAAIACQVWKRRNHLIFEDSFATPESVIKVARIGIGVVIRDSRGRVIASLKSPKDSFPDAHLAESMAALKAVTFCKRLGLERVILEGDAQQVVKAIQDCSEIGNSAGIIIRDIKQLLTMQHSWSFNFTPRTCNLAAHNLAKAALKLSEESICMENSSSCIHPSCIELLQMRYEVTN